MRITLLRSLIYAGILASGLAIFVDAIAANWDDVPGRAILLAIWMFDYLFYKSKKLW